MIVLWNVIYMNATVQQLRREGYPVRDENMEKVVSVQYGHINMQGRYSFTVPEAVSRREQTPTSIIPAALNMLIQL
ncbi:hypothetical protein C6H64_06955 [Photorhabdus luminescens]|nr:hypothetical protein C6H64_06955 [Photorhabdus luminescens]PQQ34742.1 hypothetical protein C6H69_03695 [Photorhabdus luminescens]